MVRPSGPVTDFRFFREREQLFTKNCACIKNLGSRVRCGGGVVTRPGFLASGLRPSVECASSPRTLQKYKAQTHHESCSDWGRGFFFIFFEPGTFQTSRRREKRERNLSRCGSGPADCVI